MTSLQDIRYPLRNVAKRSALEGVRRRRGALQTLSPLMVHGDEKTKTLAKALTVRLTSLQDIRYPLRNVAKRSALESVRRRRGALQTLSPLMVHGDEKTKVLAKALTVRLIHDTMLPRMHDPAHGALPRFEGRLRRAVGSFKDHIR